MKVNCKAEILKIEKLKEDLYKFSIKAEEIVNSARPGQFIEVRVVDGIEPLLRRPISIYNLDKENGVLEFIFQVKGKGTNLLSMRKVGEEDQQDQPLHPAARPAHPMRDGTAPCGDDGDGAGQRGSAGGHRPHPQLQP